MRSVVAWAQRFAMALGGPGLLVVAFLDASLLSLPEINDILIVWMVTQHKELFVYYATMSTLGSVGGCFLLYGLARKGGDTLLKKWFHERHIERGMATFQRYGLLALLVPAILPPPAPFKIFVLLAGIARVPVKRFAVAIAVGRGVRYFGEGLLAVWYGQRAMDYIRDHGTEAALIVGAVVLVGGVIYFWWKARQEKSSPEV